METEIILPNDIITVYKRPVVTEDCTRRAQRQHRHGMVICEKTAALPMFCDIQGTAASTV